MRAEYQSRLDARKAAAEKHEVQFRQLGNARLATVVGGAVLTWLNFWLLPIPAAIFIVLLIAHERVERSARAERRALAFYQRGLDRVEGKWVGKGETGDRFRSAEHPYSDDLDIFGNGSLFQLLCTARTGAGESVLAEWLKAPASRDEVEQRQYAVQELRPGLDFREDLALLGEDVRSNLHVEALMRWGDRASTPLSVSTVWGARILSGSSAVTAVGGLFGLWPAWPFLLTVLFVLIYNYRTRALVEHILEDAELPASDLGLLSEILARIEREPFKAERLIELRREMETEGLPASKQILRLRRLIEMHDWAHNQAFAPIAFVLLWKPQLAFAVERWRVTSGRLIGQWIRAVGEVEALNSIAAYAAEHPEDPFPRFVEEQPAFRGEGLGHPLLPSHAAVPNSVELDASVKLLLVSGSNMSGKSTLLRSVGLAVAMGWAGVPVRAKRLELSALQVGASMRVNDSITDGKSRFYAEITRLRQIVELSSGKLPLLFLLDELLSGTNSHDRRVGAEAVVRSLVERGAVGLVTTHDLALAKIVDDLAPAATNVHFEDHIENGRIAFDYRMRPGVVTKSNALELMRSIGLDV